MRRPLLLLFGASLLTSCALHAKHVVAPVTNAGLQLPYVDLQPGWRVRVVTPLTNSGSVKLKIRFR